MTPILVGVLGAVLAFGAGTWYGITVGEDMEYAKRAREDSIVEKVYQASTTAAAEAISKIKVRNTTIRQEVEREVQTNTIYSDCRHADGMLPKINEALTGHEPKSPDNGKLPRDKSAGR